MARRSQFPRVPRQPRKGKPEARRPRDWRRHTHVLIDGGQKDWDGAVLCGECGFRADHRVHDLNQTVSIEAAEFDARRLGEGGE